MQLSHLATSAFEDPGNVFLTRKYINSIQMGSYFTYELTPEFNAETMPFLQELKIQLRALRGDGDLYASLKE